MADAGDVAVRLTVDGDDEQAREKTVAELGAGQERELRFDDVRLKKGERKLVTSVDAKDAVAESGEDDNERTVTASCKDDD
jgi:subtilase family serine protease